MGQDNITINGLLFLLMIDGFIYVFYRSWQVHISGHTTTALEDKFFYAIVITLAIKSLIYLGLMVGIDNPYFNILIYGGDVGLFVIALVLGLMAHQIYKDQKKTRIV